MKKLHDLPIRIKIALLLGIPVLGLLGFGGQAILSALSEARSQENRANRLEGLIQLSTKTGALVHSLQKERGLSAGFLGSGGDKFGGALNGQHDTTDTRVGELRSFLEGFAAEDYGSQVARDLRRARSQLGDLDSRRQAVSRQQIATSEAVGWYTELNGHLLDVVGAALKQTKEGPVTREIGGYYFFLEAKERAGIERAVLANTFAQGAFGDGMFRRFASLVAKQDAFRDSFRTLASPEAKSFVRDTVAGEAVRTTERMRQTAFDQAGQGGFGIDPEAWFEAQTAKIDKLKAVEDHLAQGLIEKMEASAGAARATAWTYLALGLVLLLATVSAGLLLVRTLVNPLENMVGVVRQVAANDLTVHYPHERGDEIGHLGKGINHLVDQMRSEIEASHARSSQVASASQELSATSDQIGSSARESSQKVDHVSNSATEVNNVVQDVANNITEVSDSASKSTETTKEGMQAVDKASQRIQQLRESGERVDEIMETIQAIAKKTDLLALNAAIEAANAGEQGKGFAVVADEVRKLAEQTSEATGQVSGVVAEVRTHSDSSVEAMEEVQTKMRNVLEMIEHTDQAANQIASAAEELAATMSETTGNMDEINRNADQVAEGVDQIDSAVRELEQLAGDLQESLGKFKIEAGEPAPA